MNRTVLAVLALAAIAITAVTAWRFAEIREREQLYAEAVAAADRYLAAVGAGSFDALEQQATGDRAATFHEETFAALEVTEADFERQQVELTEDGASATFTARLVLAGLGAWEYDGRLRLVREEDEWLVDWEPAVFHPDLEDGQRLTRTREWPERASILDRSGEPLEIDLLVGEVTELTEPRDRNLPGDLVGHSGLQATFDSRLAGAPTGEVIAETDDGQRATVLHTFAGDDPRPVRTTISPEVQAAAERVTQGGPTPRAIVAIDAANGEMLAVANWPRTGFNRAMEGRYPPGSTFKVVTAAAILRAGTEPDDIVGCPERYEVGGWSFRNFEEMALGNITFQRAVYDSCNTAFVALTEQLDDDTLLETVADFGFDTGYRMPVPVLVGTFPEWENDTVKAAQGFGQGRVEAPPAHLATVAAAIADGTWRPPQLVIEPEWDPGVEPRDVEDVADPLREMMRLVTERGTAADARLPTDVSGKTGTAEYGTGDPLPTHAWFIGYAPWQDRTIAFAVLVEEGEAGGRVAAPLARRFLAELRG